MIIAIDGPSGAGKSTVSKAVARRLGFSCLDTGAMYRSIAWQALQDGVSLQDGEALGQFGIGRDQSMQTVRLAGGEFAIGEGDQHLVGNHGLRHFASIPSLAARPCRARDRRLITVPIGIASCSEASR